MVSQIYLHKSVIEAWGAPEIARVYMTAKKDDNIALSSSGSSIMQLLGLLLVFVLILVAAVYATKWIGKTGMGMNMNRNISVIEMYRLSQNQGIQIVKITDKYFALSVSKEKVEVICEIEEDKINFEKKQMDVVDFKEVLEKVKKKIVKVDENDEKKG